MPAVLDQWTHRVVDRGSGSTAPPPTVKQRTYRTVRLRQPKGLARRL